MAEGQGIRSEWIGGRWPLLASFLGMMISTGPLFHFSAGVFMQPLNADFGWTRVQTSMGVTIIYLGVALAAPFVGYMLDRFSMRVIIVGSGIAVATTYLLLGLMPGSLGHYYAIMVAMALLGAGCSTLAFSRVINLYFDRMRGTANALGLTGSGVASSISPLLLALVIENFGWRIGYFALGAFVLVMMPIIWFLMGRGRQVEPVAPDLLREEKSSTPGSGAIAGRRVGWTIFAMVALVSICFGGLVVHFVSIAQSKGFTAVEASAMAGLIGGAMAVSRLLSGVIMDRVFAPFVGCAIFALGCLGCFAIAFGDSLGVALGAVAIGMCAGTEMDLIGYLTARYFGIASFGRIYAWFFATAASGAALSPLAYAYVLDTFDSYSFAMLASAVMLAAASLLMLTLPPFPRKSAVPGGA